MAKGGYFAAGNGKIAKIGEDRAATVERFVGSGINDTAGNRQIIESVKSGRRVAICVGSNRKGTHTIRRSIANDEIFRRGDAATATVVRGIHVRDDTIALKQDSQRKITENGRREITTANFEVGEVALTLVAEVFQRQRVGIGIKGGRAGCIGNDNVIFVGARNLHTADVKVILYGLDPDVLSCCVGRIRRSIDLISISRIFTCVNIKGAGNGGSRLESIIIPTRRAVRFNGTVFNVDSPIHLHGPAGLRVNHELAGLRVPKVLTIGFDGSPVCSCRQGNATERNAHCV